MTENTVKKLSLKNYQIILRLQSISEKLTNEQKKELLSCISDLKKFDKEFLKESNVKFSDKVKAEIANLI